VNIPTVIPPPRKRPFGPKAKLTPMQEVDLWSWHKAKEFLGTKKQKARELGITVGGLNTYLSRMRKRERRQVEP
jgi:hypothetical protein